MPRFFFIILPPHYLLPILMPRHYVLHARSYATRATHADTVLYAPLMMFSFVFDCRRHATPMLCLRHTLSYATRSAAYHDAARLRCCFFFFFFFICMLISSCFTPSSSCATNDH